MAANVDHRLGDGDSPPQWVHPLGPQPEQLARPQAAIGGEEHGSAVARVHGVGQRHDLGGLEKAHLHPLDPGEPHPVTR